MTLKDQIDDRRRRLKEFNRWEAENLQPLRPAQAVLADLSFLLS
jgi:hypothetical protein